MIYVNWGYAICLSSLALYATSLVIRKRRLLAVVARQKLEENEVDA